MLAAARLRGAFPEAEDFVEVSGPASPRVACAVARSRSALTLVVEAEAAATPEVAVGLSAARTVTLSNADARMRRGDGTVWFTFAVPSRDLVTAPADWAGLRLGLAVAWPGGPFGQDRQRERFRHTGGAPHLGLSPAPADWLPFDLAEYEALVADRRRALSLSFAQPMDGKATIVLETIAGERLRNLVSGRSYAAGRQRVEWDGLDEAGNVVAPGAYRWRAISHPGVRLDYLFSFCNDGDPPWRTGTGTDMWGPDHSALTAAATGAGWTFLGGSVAESGYAIVAVDATGTKRMHYNAPHGTGLWAVALAADERFLYAAHDGFAWGQQVDRDKPDWKGATKLTLTRYEIASGQVRPFPGQAAFAVLGAFEIGPGSTHPSWDGPCLTGLARVGDRLYLPDRGLAAVRVLDRASGTQIDTIPLADPGPLAAQEGRLLVVSGGQVLRLDPASKQSEVVLASGAAAVAGLAAGPDAIYVSDSASHTVRVFDTAGRPVRELGRPGGYYAGAYDPERLVAPRGLALADNGWLWVTEDRWNPKRVVAWDPLAGRVMLEKFGPTSYGAPEAGVDPADPTRWVGQGALWVLDVAARAARPTSILFPRPGHLGGAFREAQYAFHREGGRTFLLGLGGVSTVSELLPDGSLRDLAFLASTHRLSFACDWKPPTAFVQAFDTAYPDRKGHHADKGPGVLWADRNGDGLCQGDEFDFATASENFAGAYWGHRPFDLTFRVPATVKGRRVLVVISPQEFLPNGVPRYPALNEALAAAHPIDLAGNEVETAVDRFGNLVCNSDPAMTCFAPDGRLRWSFPNRWSNVHGSHAAPLPETGVMQGCLYFLGMAPLDDRGDVFVMNGNHGRFFALTSDGFYLDEMFKDVRMGSAIDAYLIGGECFGGCFAKSDADGAYYLQSGHTDYRLFRLRGLEAVRRSEGTLTVSPEQALAAAANQARRAAAAPPVREATIPFRGQAPTVDGEESDWPREPAVGWDRSGRFPVSVRAAHDGRRLYLLYQVQDPSPWVNQGRDWTMLFKTGDSVDLQLGTDAGADPARRGPVPGDLRLLIAPFQGKTKAVLYRHRVPGTRDPVVFTSPWRSEAVDSVAGLDGAEVAVRTGPDGYRVEAAVLLADLGLAPPAAVRGDFGVIYGDPDGTIDMLRSYWANPATGLVNDVPGEIMLQPNLWGTVRIQEADQ